MAINAVNSSSGAASQATSLAVDAVLDEDEDPELEPDPDLEDEE